MQGLHRVSIAKSATHGFSFARRRSCSASSRRCAAAMAAASATAASAAASAAALLARDATIGLCNLDNARILDRERVIASCTTLACIRLGSYQSPSSSRASKASSRSASACSAMALRFCASPQRIRPRVVDGRNEKGGSRR